MGFVYRNNSENQEKREKIMAGILWGIIITLGLLAAGKLIFELMIAPGIRINNIIVETDIPIAKEDVIAIAGIDKNKYYFNLDLEKIKENLGKIPQVRESRVEKVFPDTVRIHLYRREPLVLALARDGSRSIPLCVDGEGMIIKTGKEIDTWELPVLSGLRFKTWSPGVKLPDRLLGLLKDLGALKKEGNATYQLISEIEVEPLGNLDYELVVYFSPFRRPVRLGNRLDRVKLEYALMVLDLFEKKKLNDLEPGEEIDFRTEEVVYKDHGGAFR